MNLLFNHFVSMLWYWSFCCAPTMQLIDVIFVRTRRIGNKKKHLQFYLNSNCRESCSLLFTYDSFIGRIFFYSLFQFYSFINAYSSFYSNIYVFFFCCSCVLHILQIFSVSIKPIKSFTWRLSGAHCVHLIHHSTRFFFDLPFILFEYASIVKLS